MKKILTLALCCLFFISSFAQKNIKEGFVILNNNDTLRGVIDYREWYQNPGSILFSTSREKNMQRFSVKDISYFTIGGTEIYQRYKIKISMDMQSMDNSREKDTSSRTDSVFLKVLQAGKNVTLFSYADDLKERLYILPRGETIPVELQNSEYMLNGQLVSENQYRLILLNISRRYNIEEKDIQTLLYTQNYSRKNINDICYRINEIDKTVIKQQEKTRPSRFRFFAGIGVNRGQLIFNGDNHYAGKTNSASYELVAGVGADIFLNPSVGKLFLRSRLSASGYKAEAYAFTNYNTAKQNYYLRFKQTNIALEELLNYNLYNGKNFKWSVGAGAGFNFSFYPLNQERFVNEALTDTSTSINNSYAQVEDFWLNASFRTGFSIRNLEITLAYYPKSSISQSTRYGIDNSSLQLQVNYLFY